MKPDEIKKKIQQARSQGVPDEVTFKYLNDKGLIPKEKVVQSQQPVQEPIQDEVGGFQGFAQTIAKPFLKIASSARNIGAIAGANSNAEVDATRTKQYDYGYFGKVAGLQGPIDSIGTGAEIGSYAIGGGGAAKTVATGLKGKILSGIGRGLATGAASGGTMSLGQALQEADVKPADVAIKTLFGAAIGGAAGGVLGGIAPVIVKGANLTKRFTNVEQINTELQNLNTQVFKPTPKQLEKWSVQGKDPMKTYTEIFGTDVPTVGKDNRFTRESITDAVQRVDDIYKPAAEGFNTILRNSPEVNSISKARDMAVKNLDAYNLTPEMKVRATQRIEDNFNAIRDEAAKSGKLLGDDSIPVAYSDNLKDRFWAATKNFGTEDATIANSVNSSIGHGFKDSIENSIQDINVKAYNRQLGDLIVLRDFLETKSGALAGTGGRMSRLMARVAGTVAGSQGGPIGAIMGNITGDKLAQIMINPAYQPYRWLINKKLQQLPQAQILKLSQEANEVIERMLKVRMGRLALPEPGRALSQKGRVGGAVPRVMTPSSPTTFEASAQKINRQPLSSSESIPPTTKPTTIVPRKKNIPKTVPQSDIKASIQKAKASGQTFDSWVKKQPVVYHGTSAKLKQFNNKQGTFFTDDMMNADGYAGGENVYEGYINLKKPLVIDAKGKLHRELNTPYGKTTREIVANVDSNKYDGVIFKNIKDSWIDDEDFDTPITIYYAFKPRDSFVNRSQLKAEWDKLK